MITPSRPKYIPYGYMEPLGKKIASTTVDMSDEPEGCGSAMRTFIGAVIRYLLRSYAHPSYYGSSHIKCDHHALA